MFACTVRRSDKKRSGSRPPASMTARSRGASAWQGRQSATGAGRRTCERRRTWSSCPRCWTSCDRSRSRRRTTRNSSASISVTATSAISHAPTVADLLDARYPRIVDEARGAPPALLSAQPSAESAFEDGAGRLATSTAVISSVSSRSTARARSTTARSRSRPGNSAIVAAAPWAFLRGCIRSDGCAFVNRTGPYEYVSYGFANLSVDILDLVESNVPTSRAPTASLCTAIRLNRREDVARLLAHVGMKS